MKHLRAISVMVLVNAGALLAMSHSVAEAQPTAPEPAAAQPAASPSAPDTMAELWDAAKRASAEQNWALCRAKASAAWALERYGKLAGLMGHCELALKEYVNAAKHLAYAVEHPGRDDQAALKALLAAQYARAQGEVAALEVSANQPDAVLLLNGEPFGVGKHFVPPGPLVITARRKGFEEAARRVDAEAGGDYPVRLVLKPIPPPMLPLVSQPNPPPLRLDEQGAPIVLYIGVGVAALGLGGLAVGVGMTVVADDIGRSVEELGQIYGDCGCLTPADMDRQECDELKQLVPQEDTARDAALGSFINGGIAAAAGAGMIAAYFASGEGRDDGVAWRVTPLVGLRGQGVCFQAQW